MVVFSSVIVTFMAVAHCIKYNYGFTEYLYIVPFGAAPGFVSGVIIALLSWLGVKLGLWTTPNF